MAEFAPSTILNQGAPFRGATLILGCLNLRSQLLSREGCWTAGSGLHGERLIILLSGQQTQKSLHPEGILKPLDTTCRLTVRGDAQF